MANQALPVDKMPEAEVTLRLAMAIIEGGHTVNNVFVAIDGAQVKTRTKVHFPIVEFLNSLGWSSAEQNIRWQCSYQHTAYKSAIVVHSSSGEGDLVVELKSGRKLRVESKKGPLVRSKSSPEYPLIREAIGQLMTIKIAHPNDLLAVAVPHSEKFADLANQWRNRPLMKNADIHIITVRRDNSITGLENVGI
ncbi:MAG: hypothetical protein NTY00_05165 [Deltaproteobacteria bacterium]|nr:hypothetical protein [Deltaproteobacteria bacterium]